ncbi:hypothetical protein [Richelia sinica]|nr:hypothetical protein [Richelia sinica]MBD2665774.1 hypothetical protein [Richelia sinica FACHB-800]
MPSARCANRSLEVQEYGCATLREQKYAYGTLCEQKLKNARIQQQSH